MKHLKANVFVVVVSLIGFLFGQINCLPIDKTSTELNNGQQQMYSQRELPATQIASSSSSSSSSLPITSASTLSTSNSAPKTKTNSDTNKAVSYELETHETGYMPSIYLPQHQQHHEPGYGPPPPPPPSPPSSYSVTSYSPDNNADKSSYAKQASDWSLYDQGAHGLYDKYGDKAWTDGGYQSHASHGKHDSHSNVQNSHASDNGNGYYSRDRGYGFERQYAFDRVIDSKTHSNNHQSYANTRGLNDAYGVKNDYNFNKAGHDKFGLANKYGHAYRQVGSHDDYAHGHSSPSSSHYGPHGPPPPVYKSHHYYSGAQYPQMPSYY